MIKAENFLPLPNKDLLYTRYATLNSGVDIVIYYYTDGTYHGNNWDSPFSLWKIIDGVFHYKHETDLDFQTGLDLKHCKELARLLQIAMAEREFLE